jgi:precorrin-6A/cobalt-precorrin-6A reductase
MKLLLIAGIGESVALARELSVIEGHEVICVTQGRAVARAEPPAKICDVVFQSDADFSHYVEDERFDMVVDAAHPFEARLGTIARGLELPYLRVTREIWTPKQDENWISITSMKEAVAAVPKGARVFLATGRCSVHAFEKRADVYVMCRQLEQHDRAFPLDNGAYVFGAGPFSVAAEMQTFKTLKVDCLILRNSGSVQGRSKVDAAGNLGVKVIMIQKTDMGVPQSQTVAFNDVAKRVAQYANY